jgi:hypothetical protein
MFIIWRGWGVLVVIIPIVFLLLGQLAIDAVYGDGFYKAQSSWFAPLMFILSSPLIYYIGYKLNDKNEKILIDPETNEEVILKKSNDLFWIPMQYWAFIVVSISIWTYFSSK